MTIAERKAREAYDRENPWRPMTEAKADGTVCELLFCDLVGSFDADPRRYFLDPDGNWYRIDPAAKVYSVPMNWRPAFAKLTPERRHYLRKQADPLKGISSLTHRQREAGERYRADFELAAREGLKGASTDIRVDGGGSSASVPARLIDNHAILAGARKALSYPEIIAVINGVSGWACRSRKLQQEKTSFEISRFSCCAWGLRDWLSTTEASQCHATIGS